MITKYQLAIIGNKHPLTGDILSALYKHLNELGIDKGYLVVLDELNFAIEYKANAPLFCLYFGDATGNFKNEDILGKLIADASLVLPVVHDIKRFTATIPAQLHKINGFELASAIAIEPLVNLILEGLGLLRTSRRLFISYKRDESSTVAMQLYESLEKSGFDVFLDTHSIRPGEPFQDELWHRLADTDIVVLLNTPGFLNSQWTREELAKANAMQIGILQLLWPAHKLEVIATLSIPFALQDTDFGNNIYTDSKSYLVENTVKKIVEQAEYLRARSLAARQDNIVTEFMQAAKSTGKKADLHPQKFIQTKKSNGDDVIIIPTVGVPQALSYNKSDEVVTALKFSKKPTVFLLYDHINIRDKWLKHLDWLNTYLPIQAIKITNAEKWLQSI